MEGGYGLHELLTNRKFVLNGTYTTIALFHARDFYLLRDMRLELHALYSLFILIIHVYTYFM